MWDDDKTFDDLDEFFSGGGGPKGYSWDGAKVGQSVTGVIFDMEIRDKIDMETKEVEMNEWGKPKKVLVLSVLTDLRDDEIEGDDGTRRLFLQGNALFEFKKYLRDNGIRKPLKGGRVKQTLVGKKKTKFPKPQNLFEMLYADPTADTLAKVAEHAGNNNKVTVEDDPWGSSKPSSGAPVNYAASSGTSTLNSMRASRNDSSEAPF